MQLSNFLGAVQTIQFTMIIMNQNITMVLIQFPIITGANADN